MRVDSEPLIRIPFPQKRVKRHVIESDSESDDMRWPFGFRGIRRFGIDKSSVKVPDPEDVPGLESSSECNEDEESNNSDSEDPFKAHGGELRSQHPAADVLDQVTVQDVEETGALPSTDDVLIKTVDHPFSVDDVQSPSPESLDVGYGEWEHQHMMEAETRRVDDLTFAQGMSMLMLMLLMIFGLIYYQIEVGSTHL